MKKTALKSIICVVALATSAAVSASGLSDMRKTSAVAHAAIAPEPSTTVAGIMVSNENWTSTDQAGVYSIEVRQGGAINLVKSNPSMASVAAGVLKDNLMYCVEADVKGYYYSKYSANTWNISGAREEIDVVNVPSDLTFDPVTNKVYGGFWDEEYNGFSRFGSFDLTFGEASDINDAQRDERDIFAIAADGKGTLYCLFGSFNYLATLDPKTGQVARIKTTGLNPEARVSENHVSSMCYDAENDRLIACVYEATGYGASKKVSSSLYTLNPHTGEVTKVMELPGNACFAGLFVMEDAVAADAPGEPSNVRVEFASPLSLSGVVKFDAPQKSVGGAALSGAMMAIVNVNGVETVVDGILPGAPVTTPALQFAGGTNEVKVTMCNATHRGGNASISVWAGEDVPSVVSNLLLSVENGVATLTWTAPSAGANGGAVDSANLKYRIVRNADGTVVADAATGTSFTDRTVDTSWKALSYSVTAYNSVGSSEAVTSNTALASGALQVPFTEGFDTAEDFNLWTVEDLNGGATWFHHNGSNPVSDPCATYKYDEDKLPGDDWLISPAISLKAGETYKLGYSWRVYNKSYKESFDIVLGTAPNSASMSMPLASHVNVVNTTVETGEVGFTVPADGLYYLGIHCLSASYQWQLYIDNVGISEIDAGVPAPVADLRLTPAAGGSRNVTVAFTAPSETAKGNHLEPGFTATVQRDGTLVATYRNVNPGQKFEFTDDRISADGVVTYTVSCSNSFGSGVPVTAKTYAGVDAPGAVRNLVLSELNNHPHLTWEIPSEGANGGWFDESSLTYRIVRSDGAVITESCTTTSYTDNSFTSPSSGQEGLWYLVTPYSSGKKGTYMQTELMLFGKPYPAPVAETFANAGMSLNPWSAQSATAVNYSWTLDNMGYNPVASDQNGDRGLATFHSVGEPVGATSYFYSPMIDISSLNDPEVSFWLYHAAGDGNESMDVLVSAGTDAFLPLEGAKTIRRDQADGWVRYAYSLKDYKTAPWVRIGFMGTCDKVADMYLDNFAIGEAVAVDAALSAFSGPARIAAGETAVYKATILNAGRETLPAVTLTLTDLSGNTLGTATSGAVEVGKEVRLTVEVAAGEPRTLTVLAGIKAAGDTNSGNDLATFVTKVVTPSVAAPDGLQAVSNGDGSATLTWNDASTRPAVTDDVESYTDWAIDGVGEWSMWDGDYDLTYMISNGLQYPNATDRKAFQVCNANALGIDIWDEGMPHSGNKMFMAMASQFYVNNDWLISPELNGKAQWISFFARSFTLQDTPAERMRVWYSTTDNDPANFTEITTSYIELSGTWKEFEYYLPEGTRHFAINCVSDGAFAMFVDDLSFNDLTVPNWTLTGYDVYCNGVKIGSATDTGFTDTEAGTRGKCSYAVKAVYDRGESALSEAAELDLTGVDGLIAGASAHVYASAGEIHVDGAEGLAVAVYNPAGTEVFASASASASETVAAVPGVYLVRVGESTFKIVVK